MRTLQKIVLSAAALLVAVIILFPPWLFVFDPPGDWTEDYHRQTRPASYHFLFSDLTPNNESEMIRVFSLPPASGVTGADSLHKLSHFGVIVDKDRLYLEIGGTLILTLLLGLLFRHRESNHLQSAE